MSKIGRRASAAGGFRPARPDPAALALALALAVVRAPSLILPSESAPTLMIPKHLPPPRARLRALALALFALACLVARSAPAQRFGPVGEFEQEYGKLRKAGQYEDALRILNKKIEEVRRIHVQWAIDRADLRFEVGQVDLAIEDLELIVSQIPEPMFYARLAELYEYRGFDDQAEATLKRGEAAAERYGQGSLDPDNTLGYLRIRELRGANPRELIGGDYEALFEKFPDFPPARIAAANLALSRGDYQVAEEQCLKALEKDAENVGALAALAETYWKSSDDRLKEVLGRIEKINPRHAMLKLIRAELALDLNRTEEALKLIGEVLAYNPNHARALALKAAAQFVADDVRAMKETQREALRFNSSLSLVYKIPARVASRHYRFQEAVDFERAAIKLDGKDFEARALLAFDLLRLGREDEGRRELEEAFQQDKFNVQLYNMLKLMDTLGNYALLTRGPFALSLPKDEESILADDALALLHEAYDKYSKKYKVELATPISVQIFNSHDDFMVRSVGLPGSIGFLGICFGRLVTMDSPSARPKWAMNWRSVLWHEFVHVVTLQKTKNRMPRWLSEGISVYEETQKSPSWGQKLELEYKAIVDKEPLPGLSELESYFTQPKTSNHLMFGYYAAGEFVRFYVDSYGFDALLKALDDIGAGGPGAQTVAALAKASGKDLAAVDTDFRAYLTEKVKPLSNLPAVEEAEKITPGMMAEGTTKTLAARAWAKRDSPFTNAMREGAEAIKRKDFPAAEAALIRARSLFPDYMGGDSPLRLLAQIYDDRGDREKLLGTLREELAVNPRDFPTARRLAEILQQKGDWDGLIQTAEWAMGVDPFDAPMRRALAEGQIKSGKRVEALATLAQLIRLDPPRAVDYRLMRVDAWMELKDWTKARREVLELLEKTPYYWDAQRKLLEIAERNGKETADGNGSRKLRVHSSAGAAP